MSSTFDSILFTMTKRPYVVLFLLSFLMISIRSKGWIRTIIFLIIGYTVAWSSEALSIRTGFPYGWYFYIYENLQGEWLNYGVPVWDSISYVFLCFAGLSVAELIYSQKKEFSIFKLSLSAALFTTILDLIIDPIAYLGDQWFLGKIYYYPNPGLYFGIPLSNFAGWFLVSFIIVILQSRVTNRHPRESGDPEILEKRLDSRFRENDTAHFPHFTEGLRIIDSYGGILLYSGIFVFNWLITLWLKQWLLALVDLIWISIPFFLVYKSRDAPVGMRVKLRGFFINWPERP